MRAYIQKNQQPDPEIGTDGSRHTGKTHGLTGMGPDLAGQDTAGQLFGQIWKQTQMF